MKKTLFLLWLTLLSLSVLADDSTEGSGSLSGSERCDNDTYSCVNECDHSKDESDLSYSAKKKWLDDNPCGQCVKNPSVASNFSTIKPQAFATGGGGEVVIGWGEYYHAVVDYKRDPKQGSGCSTCLLGGSYNNTSLPQLEVVRFFGSRDSSSMGFSGGWQHNYGLYLQVDARKSAPSFLTHGGNSVLIIQPGKRKSGDIGFSNSKKSDQNWQLGVTGTTNAGLMNLTVNAGANSWVDETEVLWDITNFKINANSFKLKLGNTEADLKNQLESIYYWRAENSRPAYFLFKFQSVNYLMLMSFNDIKAKQQLYEANSLYDVIANFVNALPTNGDESGFNLTNIGGNELNQTYQSKKIATSDLLKIPFNIL